MSGSNLKNQLIVTNNPMVFHSNKNNKNHKIIYEETYSFIDVLICARNNIHEGRKLLSHPLSGSVKPYETPYKTVLLEDVVRALDLDGLSIIENAIETTKKFMKDKKPYQYSEKVLKDFQLIDFSLIEYLI